MAVPGPVVAVIQARMSSSRLPGKVLMPVAGKPLLWHIVHRLGQCRTVDKIVVATSAEPSDDAIENFCTEEGILCVHGSLSNVLDRYRMAAEATGADIVLRVTGDAPLVDPDFTDYLVTALREHKADFVMIDPAALCAHEGVDALSRQALDWLVGHAADDPVAREHVTSYFKLHPEVVRTTVIPAFAPLALPHARISVDTADDLTLIRLLHEKTGAAPGELKLTEALQLLAEDASLRHVNAHVRQKSIGQIERHALICCQGGRRAGLGHVRRSLSLARAFRDQQGFGVTIGFHGEEEIAGLIRAASFEVVTLDAPRDLPALAGTRNFSATIVDVKDWLQRDDVAALAHKIPVCAVIDDGSDRRLAASHAYYPPLPQVAALSWAGSPCQPRIGWQWCVLGFDPARVASAGDKARLRIIVSMGGADPLNFTVMALEAVRAIQRDIQADFVIGPAFAEAAQLTAKIRDAGFRALSGVSDMASEFAAADIALVSFGVTAYELAALGVPAIYLPISPDHVRSATVFEKAGLGIAMPENFSAPMIGATLQELIENPGRREAMRQAGPKLLDGQGAVRIAADLAGAVKAP